MDDKNNGGLTVKGISVKEITVGGALLLAVLTGGASLYSSQNVKAEIGNVVKTDIVKTVENVVRDVVRTETVISPQPLRVQFEKEFVKLEDFNSFLQRYERDMNNVNARVLVDLEKTGVMRTDIIDRLSKLEGKLNVILMNVQRN